MIISPPFLSAAQPQQNDAMSTADAGNTVVPDGDVCAANMLECSPGNGAYPVSFNLGWHGGAHLIAPTDGNQPASVRAIADGKIVHVRATDTTKSPALQYRGVRTDDGCVVIRHDTEIGEGDNAKITFFSVYMHLQNVMPTLAVGKKIYRKDILGTPGQIYGQFPQIHFEIVCDEANLKKIIGREPGPVGHTGRTDAVYGDIWFFVPQGAKIFARIKAEAAGQAVVADALAMHVSAMGLGTVLDQDSAAGATLKVFLANAALGAFEEIG